VKVMNLNLLIFLSFPSNNPAQIHRLMPWLNRELVALLRNNAYQINPIMSDIQEILMRHDITSEEFRQYFRRYCRNSTNHFIHEFLNYARSPYDMIGYDRNVRYTPYFNSVPEVIFSSDDEGVTETTTTTTTANNNDDVISVSNPRTNSAGGRTQFTIETRSAHSTVIVTGSFGGSGSSSATSATGGSNEMATTTTSTTSSTYTPQPISNRRFAQHYHDQDVEVVSAPIPLRSSSDSQSTAVELVTQNISLSSDTDSDECRFVLERKPPHLRTPEMVSLGSESDSDVVYVESEVPQEQAAEGGSTTRSKKRLLLGEQKSKNRSTRMRTALELCVNFFFYFPQAIVRTHRPACSNRPQMIPPWRAARPPKRPQSC
jgi:E3 ubiquitin-protein ligase Topors